MTCVHGNIHIIVYHTQQYYGTIVTATTLKRDILPKIIVMFTSLYEPNMTLFHYIIAMHSNTVFKTDRLYA